jgi:two-component system capsular synthesis sensor histidine kinase RcsC
VAVTNSSQSLRVLLADDQPAFRALARQMLDGVAGEIVDCCDGAEAVEKFGRCPADWALLDWVMPRLDGLAAARAIRERHPQARIILISSHLTPMLEREAEAAGVFASVPKERLHEVIALLRSQPSHPNQIQA